MFIKLTVASLTAVVLAFAAAAAWWMFVREDAQLATSAPDIPAEIAEAAATTSTTSSTGTGTTAAAGVTLAFEVVSSESEAAYFADEELATLSVPSTAKGATNDITGTFYLAAGDWTLDETQTSTFTVDLTSLTSDEDRRDSRVQDALETGTYPTATFTVTSITGVDSAPAEGETAAFQMTGILDLHGVEKEVTWDVEGRREGNVITALATTNFLYEDFGIPVLSVGGFVSVEDDVTLQMQIIAQAA